jgi:CrcB protein
VNVLGCLIVGAVTEIGERRGPLTTETRALLIVGFLGGFTTFSAFANETVAVWRAGATVMSLANVALSVVLCVGAVIVGRGLMAAIMR